MQSTIKFSLLILMIAFAATPAAAQRMAVKNLEKYDKQLIHFGFLLGINKTNFKVVKADDFYKGDSVLILEPKGQSGFNLGIVTDLRLSDNLNLRFIPELSFSQRDIKYQLIYPNKTTPEVIKKVVESAIANAEHNNGADIDELKVTSIYVDKGIVLKRIRPRAKGRAGRITKPTCHIHVTVGN